MTENQLKVIVGLMAGMQTATVHLANVLCLQTGISHEDLATSFEKTSESIPQDVANRELIQLSLRQVASGIRNSAAGDDWQMLLSKLLH
ncbi:hypothetical protein [Sulfuriferula sp. AH1]|uniref:hypothetical protein n=1 Tax=Sulfuriferula sp. AH1 TaxID=1985873 RepID=UPI0012FC7F9F|nr:hypothetical protein [Sulfuriferula sp. AH1]